MTQPHDNLPHDTLPHDERRARRPQTTARLRRSSRNRVFSGVLGGVAEYVGASPRAIRLIFVAATLFSGGILAIGYGLLWVLLPKENA